MKWMLLFGALTLPLLGKPPPAENPDLESPPDITSPVYASPDAPFRDRTEPSEIPNSKKATFAIIGTIAAITIGLLASGSDTGKHYDHDKSAS